MKTFIITILILEGLTAIGKLSFAHKLFQGEKIPPRTPGILVLDALTGIALVVWGYCVL